MRGERSDEARGAALRQAGGHNLARRWSSAVRRERGCKAGHAGTLDPFATGLLLVLLGGATRLQRFLAGAAEDLPGDGPARLALEHRRPRRRADRDRAACPTRSSCRPATVRQRVPMTSAVRVGGERLYRKAHRGEDGRDARARGRGLPRRAARPATPRPPVRDRVLGGHLRPHPDRDARRRLLRRAAPDRDRPVQRRGRGRRAERRARSPSWSRPPLRPCDEASGAPFAAIPT